MRAIYMALVILLILPPTTARCQDSDLWQWSLGEHPELIAQVDRLLGALESGDVATIGRQFRTGRVRLFIPSEGLPLISVGRLHARTLLESYFRLAPPRELTVMPTRLDDRERIVWIVFEPAGEVAGGGVEWGRFVACFTLDQRSWLLTELRCP
jgi:hypothetical protein